MPKAKAPPKSEIPEIAPPPEPTEAELTEKYNFEEHEVAGEFPETEETTATEESKGEDKTEEVKKDDTAEPKVKASEASKDETAPTDDPEGDTTEMGQFKSNQEAKIALEKYQQERSQRPVTKEPAKETATPQPSTTEKFKVELDPDAYDADLVKQVNAMNDYYHSRAEKADAHIKEMQDHLNRQMRADQSRAVVKRETDLRQFIETLPKEHAEIVNNGKFDSFRDEVDAIEAGYAARGRAIPKDLFDRGLRAALGEQMETIARRQVKEKVTKRQSQSIARPGRSGKQSSGNPTKDAAAFAAKYQKDHPEIFGEVDDEGY